MCVVNIQREEGLRMNNKNKKKMIFILLILLLSWNIMAHNSMNFLALSAGSLLTRGLHPKSEPHVFIASPGTNMGIKNLTKLIHQETKQIKEEKGLKLTPAQKLQLMHQWRCTSSW